ncbi:MAG: aldo/keto reductase [Promethearchaeota archaeon]
MEFSKYTLGTAQLGIDYGIANLNGKPDYNTSIKILEYAWNNGINVFDTAPVYGNCEELIGSFIESRTKNDIKNIVIISKLPQVKVRGNYNFTKVYNFIKKQLSESLKALNINKLPIYLLHNPSDIFLNDGLVIDCLSQIKKEGLIEKIGISCYQPKEVEAALNFKEINAIQVPINIFDHRLLKSGLLKKLKSRDYLIFARSIYLQGLFFINPKSLSKNYHFAKKPLVRLNIIAKEFKIEIDKLALLFVRGIPEISSIIIGAEKLDQLKRNLELFKEDSLPEEIYNRILKEFSSLPEIIINPQLWNKGEN